MVKLDQVEADAFGDLTKEDVPLGRFFGFRSRHQRIILVTQIIERVSPITGMRQQNTAYRWAFSGTDSTNVFGRRSVARLLNSSLGKAWMADKVCDP